MKCVGLALAMVLACQTARAEDPAPAAPAQPTAASPSATPAQSAAASPNAPAQPAQRGTYPPYAPAPYPPPTYPPYPSAPYPPYGQYPYREPPKTLPYSEGQTIPPGYRLQSGPHRGMIVGGVLSMGIPYLIGVPFAADARFTNGSGYLLIPGIGPWLTLATREDSCSDSLCEAGDRTLRFLIIFDGMAQSIGLALIVTGAAWQRQRLVRLDVASLSIAPAPLPGGFGALATGTF